MFDRILVCLDGSAHSETILPYAVEQALRFGSSVALIRVVNWASIAMSGINYAEADGFDNDCVNQKIEREKLEAIQYLEGIANALVKDHGIEVQCATLQGSPGQSIVEYATNSKTDLIAIATRRRSTLGRTVFGSVADFVLRQSGLPILLISAPSS